MAGIKGQNLGNSNAIGNKGRSTKELEAPIAKFKGLVLAEAIRIIEEGTPQEKKELVLRAITSVLPRTVEGPGEFGEHILKWQS